MLDFLDRHGLNKSTVKKITLNNLLVYYGYPISYKQIYDVDGIVSAISSSYKIWIVGDTYGNPTHEAYADTVEIINRVRAAGVTVYGYVPVGQSTQGLTVDQIKTKIDEWVTLNIDGIFLDEFGFDYGNTRAKQIQIVNYVHSYQLPYCANAWTVEDFACDNVSEINYDVGDWRYVNYTTYNPTNLSLPRNTSDTYMFENFCFENDGVSSIFNTQERAVNVSNRAATGGWSVWALGVLSESTPGVYDTTKVGTLKTLDDIGAYVSANAYLYDFKNVGVGGFSFGAAGTPINVPLFELPADAKLPTQPATSNYATKICSRFFGSVKLTITNTDTVQSVAFDNVTVKTFDSDYPNNKVPEIIVSTTEPLNPVLNTLWIQV